MQDYCLGLIFNGTLSCILLIKKNKGPSGMAGKLNGLGGKIEPNESPLHAIQREVKEESGLDIGYWTEFACLSGDGFQMNCFYAICNKINDFQQLEAEELNIYHLFPSDYNYKNFKRMANLDWLIPMAINHHYKLDATSVFNIQELNA